MGIRLIFLCFLLAVVPVANAQFIGIRIGVPPGINTGTFGSGGGGVPSGSIQDDSGHYLQDDSGHYLISG